MSHTAPSPVPFLRATELTLASLDTPTLQVTGHYNPKEIEISKPVGWTEHDVLSHPTAAAAKRAAEAQRGRIHLEFTGRKSRSVAFELLFDGFEGQYSIEPNVQVLEVLSSPIEATSMDEQLRRPHLCLVAWGDDSAGLPRLKCVIESLKIKYTMFSRGGVPLRAVCSVTLKESHLLSTSKGEKSQFDGKRRK